MGSIQAIAAAIASVFNYLTGRQSIANQPEIVAAKKKQVEQDSDDEMARLTHDAMYGTTEQKRIALQKIRERES